MTRQLTLMAHRPTPYRRLVPQIMQLLDHPEHGTAVVATMQRAWRNREFRAFYERPLLLFAALRSDALGDGPSHPLHAALRDVAPDADAITETAVRSALEASRTGLWTMLGLRRVQTNETSRAVAWLWLAAIAGCSEGARPLVLVDVGCSAGLNLTADVLPRVWTKASGSPVETVTRPQIVGRFGLDERPLDALRADDARWLHACVWPGETQRLKRLEAGLHQLVVSSPAGSLLWVDLEVTGPSTSPRPAELWVHARAGDERASFLIGTMGYHPSEISVR